MLVEIATAITAALAVMAIVNRYLAKKAEHDNPPVGRFIEVDGVKLHYLDDGSGDPVVLLHGNGSMIQDFQSSGLTKLLAQKYRVIAFDRPGFGHSARPRRTIWTPEVQADLIHRALQQIGIQSATVFGHSWGASVALAFASRHSESVSGLVLASGYYYPTFRADVILLSGPAVPIIGDVISYTVAPIASRLLWPFLLRKIFDPAEVPRKFRGFPKQMAFRPSQLRASAEETALMIPSAFSLRTEYTKLDTPTVIIAGERDRVIDIDQQSARLHEEIQQSEFVRVSNTGHMVHQTATLQVMAAIDQSAFGTPVRSTDSRGQG
jgi:Predicted hydrolases or acyltransferases (alpha/beta hydrolase superfamily)